MRLKILKPFVDKVTNAKYSAGDEINVSDSRGKEILSHPLELAEQIEEPKETKKKKFEED